MKGLKYLALAIFALSFVGLEGVAKTIHKSIVIHNSSKEKLYIYVKINGKDNIGDHMMNSLNTSKGVVLSKGGVKDGGYVVPKNASLTIDVGYKDYLAHCLVSLEAYTAKGKTPFVVGGPFDLVEIKTSTPIWTIMGSNSSTTGWANSLDDVWSKNPSWK